MSSRLTTYSRAGLDFDVLDDGPLDGSPTVLLHGFPERATSWGEVAPLLHARGMRTYAPDQRGYSPGARPRRRRDYRVDLLADDVVALIERIGGPVDLVGHDWGAIVGWVVAARRPDLVRSWTAVSVPHPTAFLTALVTSSQGLKSWYMGLFNIPRLIELIARVRPAWFERGLARAGMTRPEIARYRREILEYGALPGALGWYRALPLSLGLLRDDGRVRVPTTFVWSDGDIAIGRGGVGRTAAQVDAPYELVVLGGVTHWIPTQAPDALAEAIAARTGRG